MTRASPVPGYRAGPLTHAGPVPRIRAGLVPRIRAGPVPGTVPVSRAVTHAGPSVPGFHPLIPGYRASIHRSREAVP